MKLDEIRERWVASFSNPEAEINMWDNQAAMHKKKPLPSFDKHDFLQLLEAEKILSPEYTSLDIGCGAGSLSIALAPRIKRAVGIDFAPGMIAVAKELAKEYGAKASFAVANWSDPKFDLDEMGYRKAFDLVFAHMTPAICDLRSLENMIEASRKYCLISKPTRRRDSVLNQLEELVGIGVHTDNDDSVAYAFNALWTMGYEPKITYKKQLMTSSRPVETAVGYYLGRLSLEKNISAQDKELVKEELCKIAVDGMVSEEMNTTKVTIYWEVTR